MSDFHKVGIIDGCMLSLEHDWDPENSYYLLMNSQILGTMKSYSTFMVNKEIDDFELIDFKEIRDNKLVFTNINNGIELIIDPTVKETRNNISIYFVDKDDALNPDVQEVMCHRKQWYSVEEFPFDTNFFKVGHAYKIKRSAIPDEPLEYALLKHLSYDHMKFVYIDELENTVDVIVSAKQYKGRKEKMWYFAIDPCDRWTDEINREKSAEE